MGETSQRRSECERWLGSFELTSWPGQQLGIGRQTALKQSQRNVGAAQRTGKPDIVADLRRRSAQRLAGSNLSHHRDTDHNARRAARGVTADQRAARTFGQRVKATGERLE